MGHPTVFDEALWHVFGIHLAFRLHPGSPLRADVNNDGVVNIQDLVLVASHLGETDTTTTLDVNNDGVVNIQDLVLVASHLGETDTSDVGGF